MAHHLEGFLSPLAVGDSTFCSTLLGLGCSDDSCRRMMEDIVTLAELVRDGDGCGGPRFTSTAL